VRDQVFVNNLLWPSKPPPVESAKIIATTQSHNRMIKTSLRTSVWLYELDTVKSQADANALANSAVGVGITAVRLKVNDGTRDFRDAGKTQMVAEAMRARGIKVLAWGYNYANNPSKEAQKIEGYLSKPWFDGYEYDPEDPLERPGMQASTAKMVELVNAYRNGNPKLRTKLLGFAPFAFPYLHPGLNYKALFANTDFVEPQLYWATMKMSARSAEAVSYRQWNALEKHYNVQRPVVMLGQAYDPCLDHVHQTVNMAELGQFASASHGPISFWCWQFTKPEWWYEIGTICHNRQFPVIRQATISNTSQNYFKAQALRWWHICSPYYLSVLVSLLVVGLGLMATRATSQRRRNWFFVWIIAIAFAWPVAAIVFSTIAVIWLATTILGFVFKVGEKPTKHLARSINPLKSYGNVITSGGDSHPTNGIA
jgi:hypothetical protein